MKTPGGRSSSIKNSDSASESWRGNINESVINSPQSQFTTERNGAMKFKIFLANAQFQIPGIVHCPPFNFFNISLLLQGTCSKRNCAVLHTTLQIGDESDFANN